jgi:hypothetical protein
MRAIAAILCFYLFGLCVQPALLPLHDKQEKKMSCCMKGKQAKNCRSSKDGCCDDNQCNPFFSQCPLCAANAVAPPVAYSYESAPEFYAPLKYFLKNDHVISHYQADILHPPQPA